LRVPYSLASLRGRYTDDELEQAERFVMQIKVEQGFACAHKMEREYLRSSSVSSVVQKKCSRKKK